MRLVRRAVVLSGVAAVAAVLTTLPAAAAPTPGGGTGTKPTVVDGLRADEITAATFSAAEWTQMARSLTDDDKQLLIKVRQAGLWEMPSGSLAQTHAASARVKQVGATLMKQHVFLDQQTRLVAARLGLTLPGQPNAQQQGFLRQLRGLTGRNFDLAFVNDLRFAHGSVFSAIAKVRGNTANTVIRLMAETANSFVMNHMRLLESTGLVDYPWVAKKLAAQAASTGPAASGTTTIGGRVLDTRKAALYGGSALLVLLAMLLLGLVIRTRRRSAKLADARASRTGTPSAMPGDTGTPAGRRGARESGHGSDRHRRAGRGGGGRSPARAGAEARAAAEADWERLPASEAEYWRAMRDDRAGGERTGLGQEPAQEPAQAQAQAQAQEQAERPAESEWERLAAGGAANWEPRQPTWDRHRTRERPSDGRTGRDAFVPRTTVERP